MQFATRSTEKGGWDRENAATSTPGKVKEPLHRGACDSCWRQTQEKVHSWNPDSQQVMVVSCIKARTTVQNSVLVPAPTRYRAASRTGLGPRPKELIFQSLLISVDYSLSVETMDSHRMNGGAF